MLVRENGVHSLIIEPVTARDAGIYTCVASNRAGENTFSLELIVAGNGFMQSFHTDHCRDNTRRENVSTAKWDGWGVGGVRKGNLAVTELQQSYTWYTSVLLWPKLTGKVTSAHTVKKRGLLPQLRPQTRLFTWMGFVMAMCRPRSANG